MRKQKIFIKQAAAVLLCLFLAIPTALFADPAKKIKPSSRGPLADLIAAGYDRKEAISLLPVILGDDGKPVKNVNSYSGEYYQVPEKAKGNYTAGVQIMRNSNPKHHRRSKAQKSQKLSRKHRRGYGKKGTHSKRHATSVTGKANAVAKKPTASPTPTAQATPSPTVTPTATPAPSVTITPSPSAVATPANNTAIALSTAVNKAEVKFGDKLTITFSAKHTDGAEEPNFKIVSVKAQDKKIVEAKISDNRSIELSGIKVGTTKVFVTAQSAKQAFELPVEVMTIVSPEPVSITLPKGEIKLPVDGSWELPKALVNFNSGKPVEISWQNGKPLPVQARVHFVNEKGEDKSFIIKPDGTFTSEVLGAKSKLEYEYTLAGKKVVGSIPVEVVPDTGIISWVKAHWLGLSFAFFALLGLALFFFRKKINWTRFSTPEPSTTIFDATDDTPPAHAGAKAAVDAEEIRTDT